VLNVNLMVIVVLD